MRQSEGLGGLKKPAGEGDFGVVILGNYRFSLKLSILDHFS